jgi:Tfp pilus assembly protein PilZ
MTDRKSKRIKKKLMVNLYGENFDGMGLTNNISENGVCVLSEIKFPTKKDVVLSIAVLDEVFELKGKVVWCKGSKNKENNIPEAIGIKITEASDEYLKYVKYLKQKTTDKDSKD